MQPEIGYRAASSAKQRATRIWPANTIGQVQKKAGPPKPKPKLNNWKTVVRIETNEKPAANEPKLPTLRCSCWRYPNDSRSCSSDDWTVERSASAVTLGLRYRRPNRTRQPGPFGLPGFSPAVERRPAAVDGVACISRTRPTPAGWRNPRRAPHAAGRGSLAGRPVSVAGRVGKGRVAVTSPGYVGGADYPRNRARSV